MTGSRKTCRQGDRCEPQTLVEALYCACHHSDLPLTSIAEIIGQRQGYLSDAVNPDRDEVQFQARLIAPLIRATDNYAPLQFLARQVGAVIVRLPAGDAGSVDLRQRFMKAASELGDVSREVERALSGDNEIDTDEFLRIDRELSETVEAVEQMRSALKAMTKGQNA